MGTYVNKFWSFHYPFFEATYDDQEDLKEMMQKVEKIRLPTNFPIGPVNVYLLYGDKLTLVDTGLKTDQAWDELTTGLHERGLSITDIEQIVLTHHHNDHAGLLEWIIEKHDVPIFAHGNAQPHLNRDVDYLSWSEEFFRDLFFEFGVPAEMSRDFANRKHKQKSRPHLPLAKALEEEDEIPGLPGWKVIETKGHSQDHISLYSSRERLFICGDHVMKGMPAGIFMDSPLPGNERAKPLLQYLESLEKCSQLAASLTFSGHGADIHCLNDVIREQVKRIESRLVRIKNVLQKGERTGFEIIQEMYPKRFKQSLGLFVSEIVSALDLLEARNEVAAEKKHGIYSYRIIESESC